MPSWAKTGPARVRPAGSIFPGLSDWIGRLPIAADVTLAPSRSSPPRYLLPSPPTLSFSQPAEAGPPPPPPAARRLLPPPHRRICSHPASSRPARSASQPEATLPGCGQIRHAGAMTRRRRASGRPGGRPASVRLARGRTPFHRCGSRPRSRCAQPPTVPPRRAPPLACTPLLASRPWAARLRPRPLTHLPQATAPPHGRSHSSMASPSCSSLFPHGGSTSQVPLLLPPPTARPLAAKRLGLCLSRTAPPSPLHASLVLPTTLCSTTSLYTD